MRAGPLRGLWNYKLLDDQEETSDIFKKPIFRVPSLILSTVRCITQRAYHTKDYVVREAVMS